MTDKGEITPKPLARDLFQKLLKDNNLNARIITPKPRVIDGGGMVLDPPVLVVEYKDGKKA